MAEPLNYTDKKELLVPGVRYEDYDNIYQMDNNIAEDPYFYFEPEANYKVAVRWFAWLIIIAVLILIFLYSVCQLELKPTKQTYLPYA